MFETQQIATGTRYTMTVALIVVAFIMIPAVMILSSPFGYVAIWLSLSCSVLCVGLAWVVWKRHSQLTMPSIANRDSRSK